MTYCIGIKTNEGVVLASDSRTNAGLDNVNIYSDRKSTRLNSSHSSVSRMPSSA